MAQIGFTAKQEPVYDRFQTLRLAYQAKHGRTYAPGFLTVLMDEWELYLELKTAQDEDWGRELHSKSRDYCEIIDQAQPVVIKQSDVALYLEKALSLNHNFRLTPHSKKAKVFDSPDQATAFLRQYGREVGDWILEPVN